MLAPQLVAGKQPLQWLVVGHEHKRLTIQGVAEMGDSPYYRQSFSLITGVVSLRFIVVATRVCEDVLVPVIVPLRHNRYVAQTDV